MDRRDLVKNTCRNEEEMKSHNAEALNEETKIMEMIINVENKDD